MNTCQVNFRFTLIICYWAKTKKQIEIENYSAQTVKNYLSALKCLSMVNSVGKNQVSKRKRTREKSGRIFVSRREQAINYTRCCEQLFCPFTL